MQECTDNRSVIHSLRTVGGGAASHVAGARQGPPHMFPQRRAEPCTCDRGASASAVVKARRMLAACGAARCSAA